MSVTGGSSPLIGILGAVSTLALSTSSASIALMPGRVYRIWSSVDAFIRFGDAAAIALTTDNPITAKVWECYMVQSSEPYLAAVVSTGTGMLYASMIK